VTGASRAPAAAGPLTRTRVYLYPEDIAFTGARPLAGLVADLGFEGVSVALTYHRARRVFARAGRVATLLGGGLAFTPDRRTYGEVRPVGDPGSTYDAALEEFRSACAERGIAFGAWLVALSIDDLVRAHPGLAARTADGGLHGGGLCPSHPEVVRYVADLVGDVSRRFAPDLVDLEAALYPAWEPAFTLTLALGGLPAEAAALAAQCLCHACLEIAGSQGLAAGALAARVREAAITGLASAGVSTDVASGTRHDALAGDLVRLRSAGAAAMLEPAAEAARAAGAPLRVLGFGGRRQLEMQGFTSAGLAAAPAAGVGYGALAGAELEARRAEVARLLAGRPTAAGVNWAPGRDPESMAADVGRLLTAGTQAVSVYNLSLVPEHALATLRSAAHAARGARPIPRDHADVSATERGPR
jgi:hypothetical protein